MACETVIAAGFTRECDNRPAAGATKQYWGNRDDIDAVSYSAGGGAITAISLKTGKQIYEVEAVDEGLSIAHEFSRDEFGAAYIHTTRFRLQDNSDTIADQKITLKESRIFSIVQTIDEGSDGSAKFKVAGIKNGLKLSVDTLDSAADNGTNPLEFATLEGEEEACGLNVFWDTDETTTDAAIATLLTPAP